MSTAAKKCDTISVYISEMHFNIRLKLNSSKIISEQCQDGRQDVKGVLVRKVRHETRTLCVDFNWNPHVKQQLSLEPPSASLPPCWHAHTQLHTRTHRHRHSHSLRSEGLLSMSDMTPLGIQTWAAAGLVYLSVLKWVV